MMIEGEYEAQPEKIVLTWAEYVTLKERIMFAEDRIRIIRALFGHKELPTGLRAIRWRLLTLAAIWWLLQRGTDPGEGDA